MAVGKGDAPARGCPSAVGAGVLAPGAPDASQAQYHGLQQLSGAGSSLQTLHLQLRAPDPQPDPNPHPGCATTGSRDPTVGTLAWMSPGPQLTLGHQEGCAFPLASCTCGSSCIPSLWGLLPVSPVLWELVVQEGDGSLPGGPRCRLPWLFSYRFPVWPLSPPAPGHRGAVGWEDVGRCVPPLGTRTRTLGDPIVLILSVPGPKAPPPRILWTPSQNPSPWLGGRSRRGQWGVRASGWMGE